MDLMNLAADQLETILRFVAFVSTPSRVYYLWRPNLRDEADNMFVELAGRAKAAI